jgi:hypothetical protein
MSSSTSPSVMPPLSQGCFDNVFRHKLRTLLLLCGKIPSFPLSTKLSEGWPRRWSKDWRRISPEKALTNALPVDWKALDIVDMEEFVRPKSCIESLERSGYSWVVARLYCRPSQLVHAGSSFEMSHSSRIASVFSEPIQTSFHALVYSFSSSCTRFFARLRVKYRETQTTIDKHTNVIPVRLTVIPTMAALGFRPTQPEESHSAQYLFRGGKLDTTSKAGFPWVKSLGVTSGKAGSLCGRTQLNSPGRA